MMMVWSVAAAVLYPALGLGISALTLTTAFAFTRATMNAMASMFSEVVQYVRWDMLELVKKVCFTCVLLISSCQHLMMLSLCTISNSRLNFS
jgi:hypothetical protein